MLASALLSALVLLVSWPTAISVPKRRNTLPLSLSVTVQPQNVQADSSINRNSFVRMV